MAGLVNKKKRLLQYVGDPDVGPSAGHPYGHKDVTPKIKQAKLHANNTPSTFPDSQLEERPRSGTIQFARMTGTRLSSSGSENEASNTSGESHVAGDYVVPQAGATKSQGTYSDFSAKMMAKMGYQKGKGLGKHSQGRVDIVEQSLQKGRRGLGVKVEGFEVTSDEWDFEKEEVPIREQVDWMPVCNTPVPHLDEMKDWMQVGKKKLILDDEHQFCDSKMLRSVLKCKTVFDNLEDEEMRRARTKCNPYETIRGAFFLNRAAMKMANMDSLLDFMFTSPKHENGQPVVHPRELLYFGDVCAGPGGFSEYVLWRKKWDAKGFGFTLKGPCDFKLEDFFAAPSELFEPHYGVGEIDGDGDIYRPDNLETFRDFVFQNTDNKGLHFIMADGGFSVEGQENIQEILSKRLYLCQFLCALMVLRTGGHFVCKLFDIFTPFSVGLVYLMYRAFDHVTLIKPVTSRPANSERYIVCKGKREDAKAIEDYMFYVNQQFHTFGGVLSDDDVTHVVPVELIKNDEAFFNYVYDSNNIIGEKECIALVKIQTFAKNSNLYEHRQADTRDACFKAWQIPDELRTAPDRSEKPSDRLQTLTGTDDTECFKEEVNLEPNNLNEKLRSAYDYRCFVRASENRWILISLGKTFVYKWDGQPGSRMIKLEEIRVELPRNTVVEVEFVHELRGQGKGQRKILGVHIVDAMFLCGTDLRKMHFMERIEKLRKFVKAIHRPTRKDLAPIRVKDIYRCEDLEQIFDRLSVKVVKGGGRVPRLCYSSQDSTQTQHMHFLPEGVCFIRTVKDPYMMAFSKSQHRKYYFHTRTKQAVFETPLEAIAEFSECQTQRLYWSWEGVKLLPTQEVRENFNKLSQAVLVDHIHHLLPH